MGTALALYSPLTDYGSDRPFGGARALSMKSHLLLDAAFVVPVGLSRWIFGSWRKGWNYWAPQTFAMTSELFFALTTRTDPSSRRRAVSPVPGPAVLHHREAARP